MWLVGVFASRSSPLADTSDTNGYLVSSTPLTYSAHISGGRAQSVIKSVFFVASLPVVHSIISSMERV